jgi:molecular chaperone IbpA
MNSSNLDKQLDVMQRSIMDQFLGFDDFFLNNPLNSFSKSNFPLYNIINEGNGKYTIELAIAGYTLEDIELYEEDNTIIIEGKKLNDYDRDYIHKGLSFKAFKRAFPLSKGIAIEDAEFKNGILSIHFIKSEETKKLIDIK